MPGIKDKVSRRWRTWVNRRIPREDQRHLDRRSLFILPTGAGAVFGILLLVMLLTGINYQNSLIYLLTFLLGAVFVAVMHQTHNNLSGVDVALLRPGEGFAGEAIPFQVRLQSGHDATAIDLSTGKRSGCCISVTGPGMADGTIEIPSRERGYLLPERVRVETRFPFGLLVAWSWLRPTTPAIVYPRPITPPQAPHGAVEGESVEANVSSKGQEQVELRPWREGDLSARVDWKRYARNGEMVVADWQGEQGSPQWLDFEGFPGADPELRLSYLAALVLERHQAGEAWGLRLPGLTLDPDYGDKHRSDCLRALATWQRTPPEGAR